MRTVGVLSVGLLALVGWTGTASGQAAPPPAEGGSKIINAYEAAPGAVRYLRVMNKVEAAGDRDKKLDEIERQIQKLLKEVAELRSQPKAAPKPEAKKASEELRRRYELRMIAADEAAAAKATAEKLAARKAAAAAAGRVPASDQKQILIWRQALSGGTPQMAIVDNAAWRTTRTADVIVLERATYRIPPAQAQALAKFLAEHVKAKDVEVKVTGDGLVITAPPAAQRAVGGLVTLLRGQ